MIIKLKLFILKLLNIGLMLRLYRVSSKNKRFGKKYGLTNYNFLSNLVREKNRLKNTSNHKHIKNTNIYLNFVNMNDMIRIERFSLHLLGRAESFFYSCCGGLTFNVISTFQDDEEEYEVILIHASEFATNKFMECIDYEKDPLDWNWHQMVCSVGLIETYLFAHEISHALYGHALRKNRYSNSTIKEYEADEYAKTLLKDDFYKIKLDELIKHCTNTIITMYNNLLSNPKIYYPKTGKIQKAKRKHISKFNSKIIYKILELEFYDRLTPLLFPKEKPATPKIML